jgi:hypothetical protein
LRGGRQSLGRALAIERTALKPHCPFSWKLLRRADALQGHPSAIGAYALSV